jgi:predicted dienelactone hydrolase
MSRLRRLARGCASIVILGGLAFILVLALFRWERRGDTTLPAPTGPHRVGRIVREWTDPHRDDPLAPSSGTKRTLVVWIWYPAGATGDARPAEYYPSPWLALREQPGPSAIGRVMGGLMRGFLTRDLARVHPHAVDGAPVDRSEPRWPVLLFAPGIGAFTTDYTTLAEELASHGYVVAGADRPYSTSLVVLSDGRRATPTVAGHPAELVPEREAERLSEPLVAIWSADMSFQLDRLAELDRQDPEGRFTGRLDLDRVGAYGHSFGGATAAEFCRRDTRCRAGVDVDGRPFGEVVHTGPDRPFLFLVSDHRGEGGVDEISAQIDAIAARVPNHPAVIRLDGMRHFNFSDQALLKEPHLFRFFGAAGPIEPRQGLALAAGHLRSFFDRWLAAGSVGRWPRQDMSSSPAPASSASPPPASSRAAAGG